MGKNLTVPILVGALTGFLVALLLEWLFNNLVINLPESFNLLVMVALILVFAFLIGGIWATYTGHYLSGVFLIVMAVKFLNWVLFWYLPMYAGDDWYSFHMWFWL
jgi:small basic protein